MWGLMWRPKPENSTDPEDKGGMVNFFYMTSRAMGLTMDFNTMMVLTMVLRHSLTTLRKLGLAKILPIDNNIWLHKVFGWTLFVQAWLHTIAHLFNLGFNVSPEFHADADPVYWARRNFRLAGYRLLPAYRPPEGCKLNKFDNFTKFRSSYPELMEDFPYYGQNITQHNLSLIVGQKCDKNATIYRMTDYLFGTAPGLFGLIDGYAFPTGMCFYSIFTP